MNQSSLIGDRFTYGMPETMLPRTWQSDCLAKYRQRLGTHHEGQFIFMVAAGVGSGKTSMAALIAAETLNQRVARRIIYVCPNRAIRKAVARTFRLFGIHLAEWNNRLHKSQGEGIGFDGAVVTYQSLSNSATNHRRLTRRPTLVLFDEIHHLGDSQDWAVAAQNAFGGHPNVYIVGFSGTPYRSDGRSIPFVSYEDRDADGLCRFRADHTYNLGEAIIDGYCRRPSFRWLGGDVEITAGGQHHRHNFQNPPPEEYANAVLSGAVCPGSASRLDALRQAIDVCRAERRKLIIFVGGDSTATALAIEDAEILLPAELESLGVSREEILTVTSARPEPVLAIEEFGDSPAWILITVNMVSEGVDIPSLSACLFLTSITAASTTVQRIGRAIRGNSPPTTLVMMFRDRRYVQLAERIEEEIALAYAVRASRPRPDPGDGNGRPRRREVKVSVINAYEDGVTVGGRTFTQEQLGEARAYAERHSHPRTDNYLGVILNVLYPAGQGND